MNKNITYESKDDKERENKSVGTTMRLNWTFRDILGQDSWTSLEHLDCFPNHFGRADGRTDLLKEIRGRI